VRDLILFRERLNRNCERFNRSSTSSGRVELTFVMREKIEICERKNQKRERLNQFRERFNRNCERFNPKSSALRLHSSPSLGSGPYGEHLGVGPLGRGPSARPRGVASGGLGRSGGGAVVRCVAPRKVVAAAGCGSRRPPKRAWRPGQLPPSAPKCGPRRR
jgi:hypothetical protein